MGILQPIHLIIILVIVLIIFGPGKLPELGAAIGKTFREFKRGTSDSFDAEHRYESSESRPAASTSNTCSGCNATNAAGTKFCGQCGAKLT